MAFEMLAETLSFTAARVSLDPEHELEKLESSSDISSQELGNKKWSDFCFLAVEMGKQKVLINQSDAGRCERL